MSIKTDAELIEAAETDARAFRELYERHAPALHRFHLGRTRDREAALELTAETFAQAWLSRRRFRDLAGGSAAPWLYAIARHLLVASVRKQRLERAACERLGVLSEHAGQRLAVEPEGIWLGDLEHAIAELAPVVRQAIQLRVVEELPYEEVARSIGSTPGAARVRVHRGLRALRELLRPKEAPQ